MIKSGLWLLVLSIAVNHSIYAQKTKADSTLETFIIKASNNETDPYKSTLSHNYISRSTMIRSQGNTFINTLEQLPGISSINTGAGISKPVIRGLSLNRVIVNEYGIKQEGQQWGIDHGLEIDQYNVDRVEVVKGPVCVLYGSDGIGGAINILQPTIPDMDTLNAEVTTTYKSNNNLIGGSVKITNRHNRRYMVGRVSYQDYESYKVPATQFEYNGYILPIYNNRLKNTGGNELSFSLLNGLDTKWGKSSIYVSGYFLKAGFFTGAFGVPRAYQLNDDGKYRNIALPRQEINHIKAIWNTTAHVLNGIITTDIGYQLNNRQELSSAHAHGYGPPPEGNLAMGLILSTVSGRSLYTRKVTDRTNYTAGITAQYQHNVRDGYEFLIPSYSSFQGGIFNYTTYDITSRTTIAAGIRVDLATQNATATYVARYDSTGQQTGTTKRSERIEKKYNSLSGSVGISHSINENVRLKINTGSAYRIPVIAELAANGVHHGTFRHEMGDVTLKAERGYLFDFGYYYHKKKLKIDFTPFVNYFTNYIYLSPSAKFSLLPDAGQIYQYREGESVFQGFESVIEYAPTNNTYLKSAIEYVNNLNFDTELPLPFTPPFSWLTEIGYQPEMKTKKTSDFLISVAGHYFAPQNRVDRNEKTTDGYFLVNASASISYKISGHKLSLYFQLRNATNRRYINNMSRYRILNLPEQGINTQVVLRLEI